MDINSFRSTILSSEPEEWHTTDARSMPIKSNNGELELYVDGHHTVAFYKPDLDLSIAWGMKNNDGRPWGPGHGGWGKNFPDETVYGVFVDLRWRGAAVYQELVCVADGGRYYLPIMDGDEPEDGWGSGHPVTRWKVRLSEIPLARLLHRLQMGGHNFEQGLDTAGAVITDY